MKLEYRKCMPGHLLYVAPQSGDIHNKNMYLTPEYAEILAAPDNYALSAWAGSKCVGGAGIIQVNKFRAIAWALVGRDARPYMRQITAKVKEVIWEHPSQRVEITVDAEFLEGHRWARMLGFTMEAPRMVKHGILGNDETLYARIKP